MLSKPVIIRAIAALALAGAAIFVFCPAGAAQTAAAHSGVPAGPQRALKPTWRELTPAQQAALKPLETDWDKLDVSRKRKWIEFAAKYQKMKPEEQARAQERMRGWALLTPEARQKARDNFKQAQKVAPQDRQRAWEEYKNLSPEERQKLEDETNRRKAAAATAKPPHPRPAQPQQKS